MHELGILNHALRQVDKIAAAHHIPNVKAITMEIGEHSGIVVDYLQKLFPIAASRFPCMEQAELIISRSPGRELSISDIQY